MANSLDTILGGLRDVGTAVDSYNTNQRAKDEINLKAQAETDKRAKDQAALEGRLGIAKEIPGIDAVAKNPNSTPEDLASATAALREKIITTGDNSLLPVLDNYERILRDRQKDAGDKADKASAAKDKNDLKQQQLDDKALVAFRDNLDPSKGRNGQLGLVLGKVTRAKSIEALATGQGDNLDSRQMEEAALGLNSLITGSNSPAVASAKALLPKSAVGDAKALQEWLTNEPTGTDQQAFTQRMMETVNREADVARGQIEEFQRGKLGGTAKLKERNPSEYEDILKKMEDSYGVSLHPENDAQRAADKAAAAKAAADKKKDTALQIGSPGSPQTQTKVVGKAYMDKAFEMNKDAWGKALQAVEARQGTPLTDSQRNTFVIQKLKDQGIQFDPSKP